jgi:uncharacterized membrane protein (UPF0127 family)
MRLLRGNQAIAQDVLEARSFFARGRGLLGTRARSLPLTTAMWIDPCNNIHTWFMHFALDVVFVDSNLVVQKVIYNLKPFRIVWPVWGARSVFEFRAGALTDLGLKEGDQLHVGS